MAKNPSIAKLNEVGQSIWYDNLSRHVLRSGELKGIIDQGVSGLTSNPTIFKKAIADSSDYDTEISTLAGQGLSAEEITEALMVDDVAQAADLLRPIYDRSASADGHASIEVSPFLAHDTKGTVAAAQRLWKKLNRPNIMIKIPATPEGLPAIRECLDAGINVNITLIFSTEVYTQVAEAFLGALEARVGRNEGVQTLASVASFFVSRVDSICEKTFDAAVKSGAVKEEQRATFFGKVGIANSRMAYAKFEELFRGPRFAELSSRGKAQVQRPLWASTGTKSAALSPVLYVEELAGKDTVNTVPPATLKALMGELTVGAKVHQHHDEAKTLLANLPKLGLNLPELLVELQRQGVALFKESYQELLDSVQKKRDALLAEK